MSRRAAAAPRFLAAAPELAPAVAALHRWYRREARSLPWRDTRDPYAIWVSEAMLQQTQVATVIPYYARWMERFANVAALARADVDEVLLAWEGLGYYSRARNLHQAARIVHEEHGDVIPSQEATFRALPGVGPYTAAAVLSIAFDRDLAVLDGNVKRVLARWVALQEPVAGPGIHRGLETLAQQLLPTGTAAVHNQAMMELGALVCTPRRPRCAECPAQRLCAAYAAGDVERFPPRAARRAVPTRKLAVAVVLHDERLLLYRRPYEGMLAGLWDLPATPLTVDADAPKVLRAHLREAFALAVEVGEALPLVDHAYTHLRVSLHPYLCQLVDGSPARAREQEDRRWIAAPQLAEQALPRASHKVLELLGTRLWRSAGEES